MKCDDIEECCFTRDEATSIEDNLLKWYDKNQRVLPWRRHSSCNGIEAEAEEEVRAYQVWVSEVMLQQTRVAAVIDYYKRWMDKWPTLVHLAQATQEEVNTIWAGLGYYRRARYLLEGSKYILQHFQGKFPRTVTELQKIPGIGKYTAGAIASIVFKKAVPVVDGNVIRVLCRLRAISSNPKVSATNKLLWKLAEQLVGPQRPGDLNQALMELGATVCTPTTPSCTDCPAASFCKALSDAEEGIISSVTEIPLKVLKPTPRKEYSAVCVVELLDSEGKVNYLLVQRSKEGLLAGLWEFPSVALQCESTSVRTRTMLMDKYLDECLGVKYKIINRQTVGNYTHVFSHIRLSMFIERLQISTGEIRIKSQPSINFLLMSDEEDMKVGIQPVTKWVKEEDVASMGLTSGVKQVYKMTMELRKETSMKKRRRD